MTEQEWLTSIDPVAMLDWLAGQTPDGNPGVWREEMCPSNRKLRLFAEAILEDDFDDLRGLFWTDYQGLPRLTARVVWYGSNGDADSYYFGPEAPAEVAHILRDIIGNPFRPVTLPLGEVCGACEGSPVKGKYTPDGMGLHWFPCSCCHGTGRGPSPVLTPLVLSIAQAAYAERNPDGTLDDATLAILADALEDAGMSGEVVCGACGGRGGRIEYRRCEKCNGAGCHQCDDDGGIEHWERCKMCPGAGVQPHPLLAALRSPGPHHPGFWALDVVMRME